MAKYRTLLRDFWTDPYIERLTGEGKLLYIYLITSPHTSNLGVLEVTLNRISYETGIGADAAEDILARLERDGKLVRDGDLIWLTNFIKYQCALSPQLTKMLTAEAREIKSARVLDELAIRYPELGAASPRAESGADAASIPYRYPIDTPSIPHRYPMGEHKQEREQERELELEHEGEREQDHNTAPAPPAQGPAARGAAPGEALSPPSAAPVTQAAAQATVPASQAPAASAATTAAVPSPASPSPPACPHEAIIALYHEILPMLPKVKAWGEPRRAMLRARWREDKSRQDLAWWRGYFARVAESDFLCGRCPPRSDGRPPFEADLEWLIKPANFVKVLEGRYRNREPGAADMFGRLAAMGYDEAHRRMEAGFGFGRGVPAEVSGGG